MKQKQDMEERAAALARYLVEEKATVRSAAKQEINAKKGRIPQVFR